MEEVPLSDAGQSPLEQCSHRSKRKWIYVELEGAGSDREMITLLMTFPQGSSCLVHLWVSHGDSTGQVTLVTSNKRMVEPDCSSQVECWSQTEM